MDELSVLVIFYAQRSQRHKKQGKTLHQIRSRLANEMPTEKAFVNSSLS